MSSLYRTYSSPNLKSKSKLYSGRESQLDKYGYATEDYDDEEFFVIGDRVYVDGYKPASVAYFGEVNFANGDWVGIVFDEPIGYHGGKVHGREYFQCSPLHGLFVRPHKLTRMQDSALGSSATSSRISTPMPSFNFQQRPSSGYGRASRSPGSSMMGSYYYDEDYRQDNKPSLSSLTRKLNSINESSTCPSSRLSNIDTPHKSNGGILKRNSRSQSTDPMSISARTEELSNRIRAQSASRSPVFNFRPKREQLYDYGDRMKSISSSNISSPRTINIGGKTSVDLSTEPADIGDKVVVKTEKGEMVGILRFLGETNFATGDWAGIELDYPDGKNDGSVLGHRYFHCPKHYGLFVPAIRVKKYRQSSRILDESQKPVFNSIRNTITSPPPKTKLTLDSYNSRSTTPSYDRLLSVASSPYSYQSRTTTSPSSGLSSPAYNYTGSKSKYDPLSLSYIDEKVSYKPKFDERDIDVQLKKSLSKSLTSRNISKVSNSNHDYVKPKAVEYTFSSSKYDGSPIARRTLIFE